MAKQPLVGLIRKKNLLGKEHSASLGLLCGGDLLGTAQTSVLCCPAQQGRVLPQPWLCCGDS